MLATSQLQINLGDLEDNYHAWRRLIGPGKRLCAVLKANAYGLGAVPIARRLQRCGVDLIAVYSLHQAADLIKTGLNTPILVLMPIEQIERADVLYHAMVSGKIELTVHSLQQIERIEQVGRQFGTQIPVHIELDTGMSRGGIGLETAEAMFALIAQKKYLKFVGLATHPASAEADTPFAEEQRLRLDQLIEQYRTQIPTSVTVHMANTFAALRGRAYHYDMVRLGLGLFGYGPEAMPEQIGENELTSQIALKPIVQWTSRIVHQLDVPKGTSIGYSQSYIAPRAMRLGVVPVGYADGYPAALSNKSVVRLVDDQNNAMSSVNVCGMVNMDQLMIDLTDQPPQVGIDQAVELISTDATAPNSLPALAQLAQTHTHEMLCRLSLRTERRYVTADTQTGQLGHVVTIQEGSATPNLGR